MAKIKTDDCGPITADTSAHARTEFAGKYGEHRDRLYVIGEGIYFSKHAEYDMEKDCDDQAERHGLKRYDRGSRYDKLFISEAEIERWYREIQATKQLDANRDAQDQARAEYEATCHEGTDAQDPLKGGTFHDRRNKFDLDRSRSTIGLSITSCTPSRYLNGSAVRHGHYVSMRITSPDGRPLVDLAMTFDQFAALLVSNMDTPCKIDEFWSKTDDCVRLSEVVKEPDSIRDRMEQRLGDRLQDMAARVAKITDELDEQIAIGKPMSKTRLAELRRSLEVYKGCYDSNIAFTVQQAKEEVSSIVEQAACSIAWQHKLSPEELAASPHVQSLLMALAGQRALPAPDGAATDKPVDG